jgi:uncharacterized protein (TIGR01777 family)
MNILVTGGTGFIGRPLCRALVAAGHDVTVLSRSPDSVAKKCGPAVRAMASLNEWRPEVFFDAVINLAGEPIVDAAWSTRRKQVLRESRIGITEQLVAMMTRAQRKPAVFLSGSAIGIYGDASDVLLKESSPLAGDFAAQLCRDWEAAALPAQPLGVRVCLLRTGLVLGTAGGLLGKMALPFRLGLGGRLGDGKQWMSWISLADYIDLVLMLLENTQASGAFNLTAPQPVTNDSFTRALARAVRRPAFFAVPSFVLNKALGERAPLVLGGQRVLPAQAQALGFVFRHAQLDAALRELLAG